MTKNKQPFYLILIAGIMLISFSSCQREKTENYPNGKIKSVRQYKWKKPHGTSTWYYINGSKELEVEYKNGEPEGVTTRWHYNGRKESEEMYKGGKRNGASVRWNEQ